MSTAQRHIIFAIDVEPDGRKPLREDTWAGLDITLRELSKLRLHIETLTQTPSRFNFFFRFDPQIEQVGGRRDWVLQAHPNLIPWLQEHGDFTGIHPHFWRWDEHRKHWFNDFADPAWRAHCLHSTIEGYRSIFGVRPIASRFGDGWLSSELIGLLKEEGIRYDLTMEPGVPGHPVFDDPYASAWVPDYRRAPRVPYHPSEADFLAPQPPSIHEPPENPIWLVPVTTTTPAAWARARHFPFLQKASLTLNLVLDPRRVWTHLSAEIDRICAEPLVFVLRAGDLENPVFLRNFGFIAERLAKHPGLKRCRFTSVDEAMENFVKTRQQD
jgi:hypothetical protein